ncbi:MAG TPA: hypothetical protein DCG69_03255, partial [Bacteroidales bacterium]|nr:hypothetical protein [Bacteroidales bacterium]
MKKIHIALVGGQTAPVYQGIIDSNSDFVILIHSMQTKDEANRIQSEINFKSELREIDPVDLPSIIAEANLLFEKYSNSELISVNITSGTKLWALIFYKVFAPLKTATIFYIDQNAKVWNLTDEETHNIDFEIDTQFRLYGNPLKKYKLISEFDETDFNMIEKIKQLRKSNYIDFFALTEYLSNKNGISEHKIASGSWVKWDKEDKAYIGVLKNKYGDNAFELKSKNIKTLFLNTGWFELEIA